MIITPSVRVEDPNPRQGIYTPSADMGSIGDITPNILFNRSTMFYQDSNTLYNDAVVLVNDPL